MSTVEILRIVVDGREREVSLLFCPNAKLEVIKPRTSVRCRDELRQARADS